MQNPGAFSLTDFPIGAAATLVGAPVANLQGMRSVSLQARFGYGTGGTSCLVYFQTSFDQGTTWCDVACFSFGTTGAVQVVNIDGSVALAEPTTLTDGALPAGTTLQGALGDQLRAKVVSTGAYAGSTLLSLWGVAR